MRRSRPQPIETVIAIVVLAVALLTGVGVVVSSAVGPDGDQSLASSGGEAPDEAPATPRPTSVDRPASPTTTSPADPDDPAPTTTAATSATTVAETGETVPPECRDLSSETSWRRTGDRSPLEAPAGASATYVEVVTNRADEPCRLLTDRCDATAVLLDADGAATDQPPPACTESLTEVVLDPGDEREVELTVAFPVPPGEYWVQVSRYDGSTAMLPVVLDDRLPACEAATLSASVNEGELFRRLEEIVDTGLDLALDLTGAEVPCTLRVTESRVLLTQGAEEVEIVDHTERWSALEPGDDVRTHAVVAPTDLAAGDHEGVITLVLADGGGELVAPFSLVLG